MKRIYAMPVAFALALYLLSNPVTADAQQRRASSGRARAAVEDAPQKAVRTAFLQYKEAILRQQGETAWQHVDANTARYYDEMRLLALNGSEEKVRALNFVNKVTVLLLRHRVGLEGLRPMTTKDVFVYAVDKGMIGRDGVLKSNVGKVRVFADKASGELLHEGKVAPFAYQFTKEDGQWKIDLTAILPSANVAMKALIEREKLNEDEFLLLLVESVSGSKPSAAIWQPLIAEQPGN